MSDNQQPHDQTRGCLFWFGILVGVATLLSLLVATVVALFGDNLAGRAAAPPPSTSTSPSIRPGTGPSSNKSSVEPSPGKGRLLSEGPVKVYWTGDGETLEVHWDEMSYSELDHYSVDLYGLYPVDSWVNDGYRSGEELDTFRVIHPVADTRSYDEHSKVSAGETWRICVTGMRKTPGGVDVTPYIIKGSKRCSDTFTVPA